MDCDFQLIIENKKTVNGSDNGEMLDVIVRIEVNVRRRPESALVGAVVKSDSLPGLPMCTMPRALAFRISLGRLKA